jgi:signal transduction histidine kinase
MGGSQQASARARTERLLIRLLALIRVVILCQAASALALDWHASSNPAVLTGLLVLLTVENAALIALLARRGVLTSRFLAAGDVIAGMAVLVVTVALLKRSANPDTQDVLYPYTVATIPAVGFAYRRLSASVITATLAAAVYISATAWRFGAVPDRAILVNATTYWAWGVAGWFVAARFRDLSTRLDQARQAAIGRETELTRERERSRHARELHAFRMKAALQELEQERARAQLSRVLHDRVLQTLEFVGQDGLVTDPQVRNHVAAEAVWLRDLVRGELNPQACGLAAALSRVTEQQTRAGMQIELNSSGLGAEILPADAVEALAGAITELLTNVRKHAGTQRAVVRAISGAGTVTITVLDHGCGFDPSTVTEGLGLQESVIARVQEAAGRVVVTSEPGAGTHVEITLPIPGPASRAATLPGDVPETHDPALSQLPAAMPVREEQRPQLTPPAA